MINVLLKTKFAFQISLCIPTSFRSSRPEVFFEKGVLKICNKFTGEHPCGSATSIKLLCNFFEITLRQGCSPVNFLHSFRKPFPRNTSGWLLPQFFDFHNSFCCNPLNRLKPVSFFMRQKRQMNFEKQMSKLEDFLQLTVNGVNHSRKTVTTTSVQPLNFFGKSRKCKHFFKLKPQVTAAVRTAKFGPKRYEYSRDVFRTRFTVYNGAFLQKQLTQFFVNG